MSFPVIDIFAGPGGLSEGFSSVGRFQNKKGFRVKLSVEKDSSAHQTLELRSFYRQFRTGKVPNEYYAFLRRELSLSTLYDKFPNEADKAQEETWHAELGSGEKFNDELDVRISKAILGRNKWVLIGGPPCQAYSLVGRARNKGIAGYDPGEDGRHFLYRDYLRILAKHWPAVFIMENVKGILSSRVNGDLIFDQIINDLSNPFDSFHYYRKTVNKKYKNYKIFSLVTQAQYDTDLFGAFHHDSKDYVIKAERYGIPQARHRVILFGIRNDLCSGPPPVLTPCSPINMSKALKGLPRLRSGLSNGNDSNDAWQKKLTAALKSKWMTRVEKTAGSKVHKLISSTISNLRAPQKDRGAEFIQYNVQVNEELRSWIYDSRMGGVCNHSARGHMTEDLYRYLYSSCYAKVHGVSPKLSDYPKDLLPLHKNVKQGHFADRFRVQISDNPSSTITSHISKDGHYYIHPDPSQCRSLTVREAARLQTFPDNYFFAGNRTNQYVQVGNAVPPLLAYKIAKIIHNFLEKK